MKKETIRRYVRYTTMPYQDIIDRAIKSGWEKEIKYNGEMIKISSKNESIIFFFNKNNECISTAF